jgi:hypothetical protein
MQKTAKVIDHKVTAASRAREATPLDRPSIARGLRAIKAAELLNLQLDDLLADATNKS